MAETVSVSDLHRRLLTEIQAGDGLSLSAAGRLFPAHRGSGTVNPATVFRWLTKGTRMAGGQTVKLEAVRVGSRWLTSHGAVARFVEALTEASTPSSETHPVPHSVAARNRAAAADSATLDALGIKDLAK